MKISLEQWKLFLAYPLWFKIAPGGAVLTILLLVG